VSKPATDTAAAAAAARPNSSCNKHQPQQPHQQLLQRSGLHLASFSSDFPCGVAMIATLPAHSVTHLDLHLAQKIGFRLAHTEQR
jgi:hypothetical protein